MKKILYALSAIAILATVTFGFVSCGSEPESDDISIVGEWSCSQIEEYYLENGSYQEEIAYVYIHLYLYKNGTFTMTSNGELSYGPWFKNGNKLILEVEEEEYLSFDITKLTKTQLVLRYNFDNGYAEYKFSRV